MPCLNGIKCRNAFRDINDRRSCTVKHGTFISRSFPVHLNTSERRIRSLPSPFVCDCYDTTYRRLRSGPDVEGAGGGNDRPTLTEICIQGHSDGIYPAERFLTMPLNVHVDMYLSTKQTSKYACTSNTKKLKTHPAWRVVSIQLGVLLCYLAPHCVGKLLCHV